MPTTQELKSFTAKEMWTHTINTLRPQLSVEALKKVAARAEAMAKEREEQVLEQIKKAQEDTKTIVPLEQVEKQAILAALELTGGNRVKAAELLGIGKTTMYRKVTSYERQDKRRY